MSNITLGLNLSPLATIVSVGLWLGMMICLELGYRLGHRDLNDPRAHKGVDAIETATFALLGLLLGFAFAGAMSRLDQRVQLIVREANGISGAYQLVDLLEPTDQPQVRALFRAYLEARLRAYDPNAPQYLDPQIRTDAVEVQRRLWTHAVEASHKDASGIVARLLLPALGEMMNVTTARSVIVRTRLPQLTTALLLVLALLSSLIAGYSMAERTRRSVLHFVVYPLMVSVTVYVVLDLDDPRYGLINVDAAERVLRQLHDSIR